MRIHHLNCGSLCPRGGRLLGGAGGPLSASPVVRRPGAPAMRGVSSSSIPRRKTRRGKGRVGETPDAGVDGEQRSRLRLAREPPPAVELAVVEPRRRTIRLDRGDWLARAAFEVKHLKPAGKACEKPRPAERRETREAIGQRDRTARAVRRVVSPKPSPEDVGPLHFVVGGRPEHALAELVSRLNDDFRAQERGSIRPGGPAPQRLDRAAARLVVEASHSEASVGRVARRGFSRSCACMISAARRARASSRLRGWLAKRWAKMTITPS